MWPRLLAAAGLCFHVARGKDALVMNEGGIPYTISNPVPGGEYSTNFNVNAKGPVEHFDVYGEIHTKYSEVYWTRNAPINLPPELVKRFDGKVMAITGYEIDQVTHAGPQPGSTTTDSKLGGFACYPECPGTDKSVPIYHAYNHHYFSWLVGKNAEMVTWEKPSIIPNPTWTSFRDKPGVNSKFPTNIVFKENPGGEFRKSYHGYPGGFAQLVESPQQWVVNPMQIDTHNRNFDINDESGYQPWFLPTSQQNHMTDLDSRLSPLIECPCTDRVKRKVVYESGKAKHYWAYMNGTFKEWEGYSCEGEPRSDMAHGGVGTGPPGPNPACSMETYHGGLQCCWPGWFLTDLAQEAMIPDKTDVYFLKWRYYFQEYLPAPASHAHLHHWVFLIDAIVNDYEEVCPNCGSDNIGLITAHLQAKDMGLEDTPKSYKTITPLVMTPHCHAPSCVREQLYNADTGDIICDVSPQYGHARYGSVNKTFNEESYVSISPCLWGYQSGLLQPLVLRPDTNLTAVKYFNNTYRHLGQMAQWTGLMVYDHETPYSFI